MKLKGILQSKWYDSSYMWFLRGKKNYSNEWESSCYLVYGREQHLNERVSKKDFFFLFGLEDRRDKIVSFSGLRRLDMDVKIHIAAYQ